jgi:hypothetical protein
MDLGNTAQFAAHALLEYYSVSLPKKVSARRQPYLAFLSNLTKNLTSQSAHLNYAVLPKIKDLGVFENEKDDCYNSDQ